MNNVVSLSGGKDSTAMLHMMLERGEPIHSVIFFDTGWEFPEMHQHIDLVERKTGIKIVRLHLPPQKNFDYWMNHHIVKWGSGSCKGKVRHVGCGWPRSNLRWCTRLKVRCINNYQKTIPNCIPCIGYAADETHRMKPGSHRYPLIEYGITEKSAIKYCRNLGYTWGGLYDLFNRVSCWCCPLQSLDDLRTLRKHRPELWQRMLGMDRENPPYNRGFHGYDTVCDLELRFSMEDRLRPFYSGKNSRKMLRFIKPSIQYNFFQL